MKKLVMLLVMVMLLLTSSTAEARLFGRRKACQCPPQQSFTIRDLSEGQAEVDVTIQWRRFTFTHRVYTDLDITPQGIVINGVTYTKRGVPIYTNMTIPWKDVQKELKNVNWSKELLEVLTK